MNWTSVLSQIFFCVLVTSAAGSVMLVIWFFCSLFLRKWNPDLVYYMLRWVVIMFLLPITYVAIIVKCNHSYVFEINGGPRKLYVLDTNTTMYQGLILLWVLSAFVVLYIFLKSEISQWIICKTNFDDGDSYTQSEFERIKEALGIKGSVELLCNDSVKVKSPFVCGLWKRKVVLPYMNYSPEQLKVVLYHELNHIKKSDILFRYLTMLAVAVNSINPIVYLLLFLVIEWSERDCDAKAIDGLEKEGIRTKQYYDIIWQLIESDSHMRITVTFPMLHGKRNVMYRRMDFMEKYRKNVKKITKPLTMALVMMFALLSTVTAYAAGLEIAEASDSELKSTQQIAIDEGFEGEDGWSDEMLIEPSDVPNIVYVNDGIMLLSGGTIDWDVPAGTRYVTTSIYMTKGTIVSIACTARPSDLTYWFGLMYASSACNVVEGSGSGAHDFTVPSNGYYRIMVENRSSQTIHVGGYYQY